MSLDQFLKDAQARCDAATPGPWDNRCLNELDNDARPRHIWSEWGFIGHTDTHYCVEDAAFIAAARTDLPKALEVIKILKDGLEDVADLLSDCVCDDPNDHEYASCNIAIKARQALARAEEIVGEGK